MNKLILLLTLILISGVAFAGIFGGRSGVQNGSFQSSIIAVAVTPNSFLAGSGDGTSVGAVSVTATGTTFSGTLAIGSGGQGAAFRLSSTTLPANLLVNGTQQAGSYTVNLVPTQAGLTNSGNAFPITITGTAVTAGCTQSSTFLAGTSGLSQAQQDAYKTYICGLVADGVISNTASMASSGATPYCGNKLDALWVMAASNTTTANKDICGHSAYTLVPSGSPTFAANQGYLGVAGSSTVYLNTAYNPATAGGNFTRNSSHMSIWSLTNAQTPNGNGGTAMGHFNNTIISQILPWWTDGYGYGAVNALPDTGQASAAVSDSSGFYVVNRTASNVETFYKAGTSIGTNSSASQSLLSLPMYLLARNTNGSGDAGAGLRIAMASIGAGLSASDITAMQTRGCAYLTAVNGTCVAAQAIASIRPTSCSFTPATRNGPVCALAVNMTPASPASTASLSLTGANSGGFHLVGSGCSNISSGNSSPPPSGPALATAAGSWTWGAATPGRPGEYRVNLNGAAVGDGLFMQVTNSQFYVNTATSGWYVWNGSGFNSTAAPVVDGCTIYQSSGPTGTPAGTYMDVSVVATQTGVSNSPMTQAMPLNGGGGNQPAAPTAALEANMDTCIVCIDFTASTGGVWVNNVQVSGANGAQANTWLDCAGASSPIWFQGSNGNTNRSGNIEPCPDITSDGLGNSQVLRMTSPAIPGGTWDINGMKLYNNDAGIGIMVPTNNYSESTYIVPVFPHGGYIMGHWTGGAGEIPSAIHNNLEFDAWEINTDTNDGAHASCMGSWYGGNQGLGCNWFATQPPHFDGHLITSQYLKVGQRVTSDGSTWLYKCMWIDDVFQNCTWHSIDGSALRAISFADGSSRMQTYFDLTGSLGVAGTSSGMTAYAKSFNMWACSSWQTTACNTSTPDPGGYQ